MSRDLSADNANEVEKQSLHPEIFVFIDYADPVRVNSTFRDLSFGGNTYKGVGDYGGIDTIEETTELKSSKVGLTLSGVPSDLISDALSADSQESTVKIWLGFINDDFELVDTPYQLFQGKVDNHQINLDGDTATIKVATVSIKRSLNRAVQRRWTSEDQHNEYPDDDFFDPVPGLQEENVKWGGKNEGG